MTEDPKKLARTIIAAETAVKDQRAKLGAQGRAWLIQNASVEEWKRKFLKSLKVLRS